MGFDYSIGKYLILTKKNNDETYICETQANSTLVESVFTYNGVAQAIKRIEKNALWVMTSIGEIDLVLYPGMRKFSTLKLPSMGYLALGYQGMYLHDKEFMAVYFNGSEECGVYHIDMGTGHIVNYFSLPEIEEYHDMTYNPKDKTYIFTSQRKRTVDYYKGNTVALDIYKLDSLIKENQSIKMIDDLGIQRNVNITNYSFKRDPEHPYKYTVDLDITKIDRSV